MVTRPTCGSTDLVPRSEALGPPAKQGFCTHLAQSVVTAHFVPRFEMMGDSLPCSGYVGTRPGPATIVFLVRFCSH